MKLFKSSISSFNIFFFGINIVLGMSVMLANIYKEQDVLIGAIIFFSILATSGFYNRMIKVGKADKK